MGENQGNGDLRSQEPRDEGAALVGTGANVCSSKEAYALPADSPLDPGIAFYVNVLREAGVETFESCQGGEGHAFPEPTVRFHGERPAGLKAAAAAMTYGFPVAELRRIWPVLDGELTGPHWEMTFTRVPGL